MALGLKVGSGNVVHAAVAEWSAALFREPVSSCQTPAPTRGPALSLSATHIYPYYPAGHVVAAENRNIAIG